MLNPIVLEFTEMIDYLSIEEHNACRGHLMSIQRIHAEQDVVPILQVRDGAALIAAMQL